MSQKELALRVFGTQSQSLVSEYERGTKQPSLEMLERIAEALNCDLEVRFVPRDDQ